MPRKRPKKLSDRIGKSLFSFRARSIAEASLFPGINKTASTGGQSIFCQTMFAGDEHFMPFDKKRNTNLRWRFFFW